jgi:hypothetical protein
MFKIFQLSKSSATKPTNLYVLLYSQFCTIRSMVERFDSRLSLSAFVFDDELMKREFRDLIANLPGNCTPGDVNQGLLGVIFKYQLNKGAHDNYTKMAKFSVGKDTQDQPHHLKSFISATRQTDFYMRLKLQEDADRFLSKTDKALVFLQRHQYLSGWITNAAVTGGLLAAPSSGYQHSSTAAKTPS